MSHTHIYICVCVCMIKANRTDPLDIKTSKIVGMENTIKSLYDACAVIDVLGPKVREELVKWFAQVMVCDVCECVCVCVCVCVCM